MAIRPESMRVVPNQKDLALVAKVEEAVDAYLKSNFDPDACSWVHVPKSVTAPLDKAHKNVRQVLVDHYESSGWEASWVSGCLHLSVRSSKATEIEDLLDKIGRIPRPYPVPCPYPIPVVPYDPYPWKPYRYGRRLTDDVWATETSVSVGNGFSPRVSIFGACAGGPVPDARGFGALTGGSEG